MINLEEEKLKLWATYGKLQAKREVLKLEIQNTTKQMGQIYQQIQKLPPEEEKQEENKGE